MRTRLLAGASGATVHVFPLVAVKHGQGAVGDRVRLQADHMRRLGPNVTGKVYVSGRNWYVMEKLWHPPRETARRTVAEIVHALRPVWKRPPVPLPGGRLPVRTAARVHRHMFMDRVADEAPAYVSRFYWLWDLVPWDDLTDCLTHGDPTFENVMTDRFGDTRVIDPLPPYPDLSVPQLLAVDVGKILQSLYGYEEMRHPLGVAPFYGSAGGGRQCLHEMVPYPDFLAAHYFLAVHWVRLLKYQSKLDRSRLESMLGSVLGSAEEVLLP